MKSLPLILPIILTLAACGGSSSGGNTIVDADAFTTADGALDALEFFGDKAARLDLTPVDSVPTAGSANYEGVFTFGQLVERFPGDTDPDLTDILIGEVNLNVDFQGDTISGNADNFFDIEESVSGSLTIANGEIVRDDTGVLFGADVTGQLPVAGTQRDIEGGLLGTFGGNQAQLASGIFIGDADGSIPLFGAFVADN